MQKSPQNIVTTIFSLTVFHVIECTFNCDRDAHHHDHDVSPLSPPRRRTPSVATLQYNNTRGSLALRVMAKVFSANGGKSDICVSPNIGCLVNPWNVFPILDFVKYTIFDYTQITFSSDNGWVADSGWDKAAWSGNSWCTDHQSWYSGSGKRYFCPGLF